MKKLTVFTLVVFFSLNPLFAQMVLTYKTPLANASINLPLFGTVNVTIEWGDNFTETVSLSGVISHTYKDAGTYTVTISGILSQFGSRSLSNEYLISVDNWENVGLTSLSSAFQNSPNLVTVPATLPSSVKDLSYMFLGSAFNESINTWNTESIQDMSYMFYFSKFNKPIGSWNTEKVTNMKAMFQYSEFNQPIGAWNTGNVTDMSSLFANSPFNQPIDAWNTGNVISMNSMFYENYSFNQPINSWNTGNVTDMSNLFVRSFFNQPIGKWNTESVTNMSYMFIQCNNFNQPISTWNTKNVIDMSNMFSNCPFNQPLSDWNTSSVNNMTNMFASSPFNQPISNWNTENVNLMTGMFAGSSFNQPIGTWNTKNVGDMSYMFSDSKFNQPVGSWDISKVPLTLGMFERDTLCPDNYDNLLIGWSTQPVSSVPEHYFDGGGSQYTSNGKAARDILISKRWFITDGGITTSKSPDCILTGLDDLPLKMHTQELNMFPNSSTGSIVVSGNKPLGMISVCNTVGVLMYQTNTNTATQTIDLSSLEKGMYLIKVGTNTRKIMKE